MKILYFDCTNGISGDMLLKALMELGECSEQVRTAMEDEQFAVQVHHSHASDHHHHDHHSHTHGRSYQTVRQMIQGSSFSPGAKDAALRIYGHIAEAEAKVHEATPETVHFHEVGRDEAIKNALGIGMALEILGSDRIYTSHIYDGKGTVVCSHGEIPVPVPAVQALMEKSSYVFKTAADADTEMVTPSGLASLMGIGAEPMEEIPGCVIKEVEACGSRNTGRGGLKVYMAEITEQEDR